MLCAASSRGSTLASARPTRRVSRVAMADTVCCTIIPSTPEGLAKAQADDAKRYGDIIKAKNIKVE